MKTKLFELQAAVFDLDGTLLDSINIWHNVDRVFLARRNIPLTPDYTENVQTLHFSEAARYTKARYSLPESADEIVEEWMTLIEKAYETVPLIPYAEELLRNLHGRGMKLGIATSSDRRLFLPALAHHKIGNLFSAVVTVTDVARGKEFADVYLKAAELLRVSPERCAVFEDIPQAARAAKSGGFYTVLLSERNNAEPFADLTVSSYRELLDLSQPRA